jgi:hypothetical protein
MVALFVLPHLDGFVVAAGVLTSAAEVLTPSAPTALRAGTVAGYSIGIRMNGCR